jgi:hypothetical protein
MNLREANKIHANENDLQPAILENPQNNILKPLSENQREIIETKDDIENEKYIHQMFEKKNAKIKIVDPKTTSAKKYSAKFFEIKCPACLKKSYTIENHNIHMQGCLSNTLQIFFSQFQDLYKKRCDGKITKNEYVITSIGFILNTVRRITEIAERNHLDFSGASELAPAIDEESFLPSTAPNINNAQPYQLSNNNSNIYAHQNRFSRISPGSDLGYISNQ